MTTLDPFSLATVAILPSFRGKTYGCATSFVWKSPVGYFLITNWHVVTGQDAVTRKHLDCGRRPDVLQAHFNLRIMNWGKQPVDIPIRDERDNPLWYVHPSRRMGIDVVAIPLAFTGKESDFNMYPINSMATESIEVQIGMDVFVLGYPFGFQPPGFPVWKRGSIASEPDLVRLTDGRLLVDTASRPGMSGSPVICRRWTVPQIGPANIEGQPLTTFLGVYSGRLHTKNPNDPQLGIVWPYYYIEEIIAGRVKDE